MNKFVATLSWTVGSDWAKHSLRSFFREEAKISRKALAAIKFRGGLILVNNKEKNVRTLLEKGDRITICLPAEQVSEGLIPEQLPFQIVYEDDHLLVINKKAGMATIPSREHPNGTLANAVLGYYVQKGIPSTFHAVNRLDKDTSGLLLVAKHRLAHDRLSKLQQKGRVRRSYEAFVEGALAQKNGTIDAPIARDPESIIKRCVKEDGQEAHTHYVVKKELKHFSHVEIELETGRTHQIRVHFSHIGHPLLGDDLYGGKKALISRQALHCFRIEFEHPFTNERKKFEQSLPEDMSTIIRQENDETSL